jgi:serine/threonine protein phosphatase PrpC
MTTREVRICPACGAELSRSARFCVRCGAGIDDLADEVLIPGRKRVRIDSDTLNLRELLTLVESGVAYWQQRLADADGVAREQAANAIRDLSKILDSLAQQIAQGRDEVRITGRLPVLRDFPRACSVCGRGNRVGAKYCVACGMPLQAGLKPRPPRQLQLAVAARTDVGQVRQVNEDTFYTGTFSTSEQILGTLLLVADGMGGHASGEIASGLARETVKRELTAAIAINEPSEDAAWASVLRHVVQVANQRVFDRAGTSGDSHGMGTTLTLAVVSGRRVHLAHVGDSRAYLLNPSGVNAEGSTLIQLSSDHSIVARLVDIGQITPEQARVHPQRNMIYRSLGTDAHIDVDTLSHPLAPGDVLLLCSDGLTGHVADEELARAVFEEAHEDAACERLVALANQRGGRDNISVVIARARG